MRAEEAYRQASTTGLEPQPGLSLLRLAQGDVKAAAASICRVASEAGGRQGPGGGVQRTQIFGALAEILLAAGALQPARAAADELASIAAQTDAPFLQATAAQSHGAVLLASGLAAQALVPLREAWTIWQQLEAPFESARVQVSIGRACEHLADGVTATMHLEAAASVFERLGATDELARLRAGPMRRGGGAAELSSRERQVLARLASGKTNCQIAADRGISEHTVARHLSNIFNKIGVASRSAATAFAFKNEIV